MSKVKLFKSRVISYNEGGKDITCTIGLYPTILSWKVALVITDKSNNKVTSKQIDFCSGNDVKYISMIYTSVINIVSLNINRIDKIDSLIPKFDTFPIYKSDNFLKFLIDGIQKGELYNFTESELLNLRYSN